MSDISGDSDSWQAPEKPFSPDLACPAYPLSPLQQGMLFHWLVDSHSGTDFEQIVADLDEVVDPSRLASAWQSAVDTFSTLRTAFRWEGLVAPLQHVEPTAHLQFTFEDLRPLSVSDRESQVASFLHSDRKEGFDLTRAVAMRVSVFRMADAHFRMIWSFHHILIDGRAFEIILNHVFETYARTCPTPPVDRPYREYIEWVDREEPEPARAFWREKLKGFTAPTPIPASQGPIADGDAYAARAIEISPIVSERLRGLAAREGLSINTIIMGAWALLLARHSGEQDVVFGASKTTRRGTIPAADSMVGLFLATIPVRIAVDLELPVLEWLKSVRREWVSLRGNEHLPLVEIRQASDVASSEPLFESLVVYENYQFGTRLNAQGGEWSTRRFHIREQTSFPLNLLAFGDEAIFIKLEYDARRFDAPPIDRMLGHLSTILESWADDVQAPLWATPILGAAERTLVLEDWNDTSRVYPQAETLAELIEAQVERTPQASAVTFGSETITYAELNARANRLARELRRLGAGPDVLIGLSLDRSIAMMVGLLAVVKSGAAYVPLDPMFPRDRLAYMIADSNLALLVTQTSVRRSLPEFAGPIVDVDSAAWESHDASNLGVAVDGDKLAVVIYTSGSTGRPKGVQVSRKALINLLWSMREWLELSAKDRVLAVTTISFDIAGADIWLPWLVGAHTIVAGREVAADGEQLRTLITHHDITFLQATPITWRQLLEADWPGKLDMQAVCTGEAMPPEVATRLVPLVRRLWNLYGPTETTIWSTGCAVTDGNEKIMIGRPVANTQCYILDEHHQPVPIGATGELYIAGDGLARGYLNRPDLTAEKFLPNPFSTEPGARMYRTGDLARFLADGTIECLGRTDHQVKIRGFRIELGEIESALRTHPDVRQAVVVAREDTPGEKHLVGYVVPEHESPNVSALRSHLKLTLPSYMIPSAIMILETIPLTANGKIDRRSLPSPMSDAALQKAEIVAPRTHVEKQLSEIWEELFETTAIGVHDDFFDLGGHSILAVKMMTRIKRVFGKSLTINALFEAPTIARLASRIGDAGVKLGRHSLVAIQVAGSKPPIYWIPGGAGLGLFRLTHIVTRLGSEQPVYGLGSNYPESLADIETVEQRSLKYIELVRSVQPHGPYCFAGFCAGGIVAYEMAQQLTAAGEPVAFVGMINCALPNFPSRAIDRALFKAQRLRYQVAAARADGVGLAGYIRQKFSDRREARERHRELAVVAAQVRQSGFQQDVIIHNDALLDATGDVFSRYQPRRYPGAISLFYSNDSAFMGLSPRMDPRFRWTDLVMRSEIRSFEADHDNIFGADESGPFAEALKSALDTALGGVGG